MAINDVKLSQLPELVVANITDETIVFSAEAGLNYKIKMGALSAYVAGKVQEVKPLGEMSLVAPVPSQTLSGSNFTQITAFDKIQYERGLEVDLTTSTVTILKAGDYRVTVNLNSEFSNNQGVEFAVLVDGVVNESLGSLQGRGNGKPVYIGGADIDPFVEGATITLGAREDEGGSLDIIYHKVRLTVEAV